MNKLVVVAGPTASGKSGLALRLAEQFDGVVVNADSMQVYDVLRVLTARPGPEELARAPHRLYGMVSPDELCSAGRWRALAIAECQAAWAAGRLPILCGGTGLYIHSLVEGLSPIPEIPDEARQDARTLFAQLGNEAFHAALAQRDPVMAARLHPSNSQRLTRAWEVLTATGISLADWQKEPAVDRLDADVHTLLLAPPRERLYAQCNGRFVSMVEQGALEEVRALMEMNLSPAMPAMKALGVPELAAYYRGECGLEQAVERAQQATRNYAKRQLTWFNNKIITKNVISTQLLESIYDEIFVVIRSFLLTTAS